MIVMYPRCGFDRARKLGLERQLGLPVIEPGNALLPRLQPHAASPARFRYDADPATSDT